MRYRIEVEPLRNMLADGLDDLCLRDWDEIEREERFAYAPDWPQFQMLERQGTFVAIGVRRDRELVGYAGFFILPHMHAKGMTQAVNNVIYLAPENRRGRIGVRLIRVSEMEMVARGADRLLFASRPSYTRTGALLEKLGYTLFETTYAKVLT